jgi:hypothetical protein
MNIADDLARRIVDIAVESDTYTIIIYIEGVRMVWQPDFRIEATVTLPGVFANKIKNGVVRPRFQALSKNALSSFLSPKPVGLVASYIGALVLVHGKVTDEQVASVIEGSIWNAFPNAMMVHEFNVGFDGEYNIHRQEEELLDTIWNLLVQPK